MSDNIYRLEDVTRLRPSLFAALSTCKKKPKSLHVRVDNMLLALITVTKTKAFLLLANPVAKYFLDVASILRFTDDALGLFVSIGSFGNY